MKKKRFGSAKAGVVSLAACLCIFSAKADETITNVMSPVVNYLYFEWPGSNALQVAKSAEVDYLYETGPAAQPVMTGAAVILPFLPQDPATFRFDFLTTPVYRYLVQFKNSFFEDVWKWKEIRKGDGQLTTVAEAVSAPICVYRVQRFSSGFLSFPIKGLTPWNATISAVFDHSEPNNCSNGVVIAFTGETGRVAFGKSQFFATGECANHRLYGCSNSLAGIRSKFTVNGYYTGGAPAPPDGANSPYLLFYDGHTGYDFPYPHTYEVVAAAAGTVHTTGNDYNTVWIDHHNGYSTYYLHMLPTDTSGLIDGTEVLEGQHLGYCGNYYMTSGGVGQHLHFTVMKNSRRVDPYGWDGKEPDPWPTDGVMGNNNVILWKEAP